MAHQLQLKFDPNQQYQHDAVESVVRLFNGMPRQEVAFSLGGDAVPNLPAYESLDEELIYSNMHAVQQMNQVPANNLLPFLKIDSGMMLDDVAISSYRYPSFTIEMETGTGKTYVYLRTIYELRQRYGFGKFIIVVPSIAIYEGVIKNFEITLAHFRAIYGNENVHLIRYDGSRLSDLRAFASSTFAEVMVITLDAFNKASNVIYKASEKLPGEKLPYEYIQETRPILILDEPQNMSSELSKGALGTLNPLFALRYSATHRENPNLIYRLTPFDAFRLGLVKRIQVFGVTERENFNQPFLALEEVSLGSPIKARLQTYIDDHGRLRTGTVTLKHGDNLKEKTGREEHRGYIVREINAGQQWIEFENSIILHARETIGPSRPEIFRVQIRKTIEQHMEAQERLDRRGIKVLSLFFIDRVANYTTKDGLIRRIFDEEFNALRGKYQFFSGYTPEQMREAYFAKSKPKKGETEGEAVDTEGRNQVEREAEKKAFELIMRRKETLLSFDEPVCFIFAHSALKEGWDNPNVFQICTLNQTVSEVKKRQEIGRGLRLAVNQNGMRVFDEEVNVLSVIANESYQSYAANLQKEYRETGDAPPPPPRDAGKAEAKRNDAIFNSQGFRDFWANLQKRTRYQIRIDRDELILRCSQRINARTMPQSVIVVEKGDVVFTNFQIELEGISGKKCKLKVKTVDTQGNETTVVRQFDENIDLAKVLKDERLKGFRIADVVDSGSGSYVKFGNNQVLDKSTPLTFQSEQGQRIAERVAAKHQANYPVPNLIERAARETNLTRPTINAIFQGLSDRQKNAIFKNPEGFVILFIAEVKDELADHIAKNLTFETVGPGSDWGLPDLDDAENSPFMHSRKFFAKELISGGQRSLYDQVQIDSDVERNFVQERLERDPNVLFYFKFPPAFKIDFPRIIGDYNPDWGVLYQDPDGRKTLRLVRETKGSDIVENLQYAHEKRKIRCAIKHFEKVGIDYRTISDQTADWWKPVNDQPILDI